MKLKNSQTIGFIFTIVIGTLLHFVYEWSGESAVVGLFGAVNESVWEHLKLLTVPMLVYGVYEYFRYGREARNFLPIRLLSILLGMGIIVGVFYTYSGIIGKSYLLVDILTFVAAAFAAYRFSARLLRTKKFSSRLAQTLSLIGLII